ncbi:methylated-DNA--[protein]-cysteine S-methyltransferase [Streptomyces sp. NPDC002490]|uniref:methylated-DNA--[protein]-cysteine S-methyltransferase n=1 Tax=Streptomyces sp. NPDC002490 TaxID=3154416 RepID=UPI0033262003
MVSTHGARSTDTTDDVPGAGPGRVARWAVVDSAIGPLLLVVTHRGLVKVAFHADAAVCEEVLDALAPRLGGRPVHAPDDPAVARAVRQTAAYFAGELRTFDLPLDWSLVSGFHREVLRELLASVPYGTVAGYGELAGRVGQPGAAQAVGAAMGANPLPVVVPCHRIVERDGGIGGFGGGLEAKRTLLALEGVLPRPLF